MPTSTNLYRYGTPAPRRHLLTAMGVGENRAPASRCGRVAQQVAGRNPRSDPVGNTRSQPCEIMVPGCLGAGVAYRPPYFTHITLQHTNIYQYSPTHRHEGLLWPARAPQTVARGSSRRRGAAQIATKGGAGSFQVSEDGSGGSGRATRKPARRHADPAIRRHCALGPVRHCGWPRHGQGGGQWGGRWPHLRGDMPQLALARSHLRTACTPPPLSAQ